MIKKEKYKLISNSFDIFGKYSKEVGNIANLTLGILFMRLNNSSAVNGKKLFDIFFFQICFFNLT